MEVIPSSHLNINSQNKQEVLAWVGCFTAPEEGREVLQPPQQPEPPQPTTQNHPNPSPRTPPPSSSDSGFCMSRPVTKHKEGTEDLGCHKPYIGSTQAAGGSPQALLSHPCDRFCQKKFRGVRKETCSWQCAQYWLCFYTVLCPRGGVKIPSPFLCIKEGFCKWIVFNFKSCDLKNKKTHLLAYCSLTRGFDPRYWEMPWAHKPSGGEAEARWLQKVWDQSGQHSKTLSQNGRKKKNRNERK